MSLSRYLLRRAAFGGLLIFTLPLASCTPPVHLTAAATAPDPICARVLQKLPREILGKRQLATDAQATVAYGDLTAPITVRCGLAPPPPTTSRCLSISARTKADDSSQPVPTAGSPTTGTPTAGASPNGTGATAAEPALEPDTIDWINPEAGSELIPRHASETAWTFLTYGRAPAVEVVIPSSIGIEQPTAVLLAMAPAIRVLTATKHCLGATDVITDRPRN